MQKELRSTPCEELVRAEETTTDKSISHLQNSLNFGKSVSQAKVSTKVNSVIGLQTQNSGTDLARISHNRKSKLSSKNENDLVKSQFKYYHEDILKKLRNRPLN